MMRLTRTGVRVAGAAAALGAAAVCALWWMRRPVESPELRGYHLADRLGCFSCHGPGGAGGVPNPGSEEGEIPSWTGGTLMMYVEHDDEIGEWIRYGAPKRLWKRGHPAAADGSRTPPVRMPGYDGRISSRDVEDLTAYVKAVGGRSFPPPGAARDGYRIAARLGCFSCHGPAGRTGSPNPGSFKGVVPGWSGSDFRDLVRNDDELKSWILDGGIPRLDRNPVARWFISRQIVRMPAYRNRLHPGELDSLTIYIGWLNQP